MLLCESKNKLDYNHLSDYKLIKGKQRVMRIISLNVCTKHNTCDNRACLSNTNTIITKMLRFFFYKGLTL